MKLRTCLLLATVLGAASLDAMACYTVYDASNRVLYQGENAPLDMSRSVRDQLNRRAPGSHLVFDQASDCRPVNFAELARPAGPAVAANTAVMGAGPAMVPTSTTAMTRRPASSTAPLLTDRRTAIANKVPFTVMSGDIVMVPAQYASRVVVHSVTVVPAAVPVATIPGTSVMGGPPAPLASRKADTVITEMHNPPLTVEQRGEQTLISRY